MAKSYKLITDKQGVEDAQRTVEVTQEHTETQTSRTSLGHLKHEYGKLQSYIQNAAIKADAIVDEIDAIRADLSLSVSAPDKMQDKGKGTIQVPVRVEEDGDVKPEV